MAGRRAMTPTDRPDVYKDEFSEWRFRFPESYSKAASFVDAAGDCFDRDQLRKAEALYIQALQTVPNHMMALEGLAWVNLQKGDIPTALEFWRRAVDMGRRAFPMEFSAGKDTLSWGTHVNRHYIRALFGLGVASYELGLIGEAYSSFKEAIALWPGDNMGARQPLMDCLFVLERYKEAVALADAYEEADADPWIVYGKALAQYRLGRPKAAEEAATLAVRNLPLVRLELLRGPAAVHPKRLVRSMTAGVDEAQQYVAFSGHFWFETDGAVTWLAGIRPDSE